MPSKFTRNFSRDYFSSVNFPSQVCNMRSSSFICVLNCECLVHNEYGFLPFSVRFWPLWLKKFTSATWGYVPALYDKIMKQHPGFLACLCKDTHEILAEIALFPRSIKNVERMALYILKIYCEYTGRRHPSLTEMRHLFPFQMDLSYMETERRRKLS